MGSQLHICIEALNPSTATAEKAACSGRAGTKSRRLLRKRPSPPPLQKLQQRWMGSELHIYDRKKKKLRQ